MRILAVAIVGFAILTGSANQVVLGQRFHLDGPKPGTLDALIDHSSHVIEATVESSFPVIDRGSGPLVSDFLIRVDQVVKGTLTSRQIVVHQFGGTLGGRVSEPAFYSLMQPGERYILFLRDSDSAAFTASLPTRGVPRYFPSIDYYSVAKIEGGLVAWSKGMPDAWKANYAMQPAQLIAVVQSRVR
jgi:hypothetical protein